MRITWYCGDLLPPLRSQTVEAGYRSRMIDGVSLYPVPNRWETKWMRGQMNQERINTFINYLSPSLHSSVSYFCFCILSLRFEKGYRLFSKVFSPLSIFITTYGIEAVGR